MTTLKILFWSMLFIIFYSYIGYGILLFLLVWIKRILSNGKKDAPGGEFEPEVTLFITAYNERDVVEEKIRNSLELDYPKEKLHLVWVTDGSDDGTPDLLRRHKGIDVYHEQQRNGKIGAMNRGMKFVKTSIVIFCDANTLLGRESVRRIVNLFRDPHVGCVSGEKRILNKNKDTAAGAGEGLYWKYESLLKKWDAELYSVVGAAGELFAIRRELYREVERDTILDDFMISLRVAMQGYTIQYDPLAYAMEKSSANVKEELKRKIRISAGGIQSVVRLISLLNVFRYGILSFQYISHRVLRWTLAPLALLLFFPAGLLLGMKEGILEFGLYSTLFWIQVVFYMAALLGWFLENRSIRIKALFIPYYFFIMNLSVFLGLRRYIRKSQTVNWERAVRSV
jgi:cellulose synthase/poly-beta-1,6-N-acetylglucosamine synthase-like glycosyltransferase